MKKLFIILAFILFSFYIFALEMEVTKFEYIANDMSNQTGKIIYDEDGKPCSVLKIETDLKNDLVLSKPIVHKKIDRGGGVYYFFIRFRERYITFGAKGYSPYTWKTPRMLTEGKTYLIKLMTKKGIDGDISVSILSEPENTTKIINNKNLGTNETFKLRKGEYELKLIKKGYKTLQTKIKVDKNNTLFKDYKLKQVDLMPVQISSIPDEAEVFINGQSKGKTPLGIWLYPENYELKLSKNTYLEIIKNIDISEKKENKFTYNLNKNCSYLNLNITPTDAVVKLNNIEYKDRNLEITPGKYTLQVSKSGYLTIIEKIDLKLNKNINKIYELKENVGFLNLQISPKEAKIYINKEDKDTFRNFKLAPATYKISVQCPNYYPYEQIISLKLEQQINQQINLKAKMGTLLFNVEPLDAKVNLLKDEKIVETWQGMKQIKGLAIGEYTIIAKADDYKTYKKIIQIKERKNTKHKAIMEKGYDASNNFTNSFGMEFVLVNAGNFQMGSNDYDNEKPVHKVKITKDYYIGKYEITQKQWEAVMGFNPSYWKGNNLPVECVSWNDIQKFIAKLNKIEGSKLYSLPTEAEWEYAAKGANKTKNYIYAGSNYRIDVSGSFSPLGQKTYEIGNKKPNELGIYDMSGNVWEFCLDWYDNYKSNNQTDPNGTKSGKYKVIRGGSFEQDAIYCRVTTRESMLANEKYNNVGFRLVREAK